MKNIAVIDYGMSNLSSVIKAVEYVAPNDNVIVSSSLKEINDADKIKLKGSFPRGNNVEAYFWYSLKL